MFKQSFFKVEEALELYVRGLSCNQVSEELGGISGDGVRYWVNKRGLMRTAAEARALRNWRRYAVDEESFERPLTPETAWVLGVIVGDGCIIRSRGRVRAVNVLGDEDVCRKVGELLKSEAPVIPTRKKKYFTITFHSPRLAESLKRYGVVPKKSRIVIFPKMKKSLKLHFVRGLWDADGCVSEAARRGKKYLSLQYVSTSSCLLDALLEQVKSITGSEVKAPTWAKDKSGRLGWSCQMAEKLGHWMWDDSQEHMRGARKHDLFYELAGKAREKKRLWVEACADVRAQALEMYSGGALSSEAATKLGVDRKSVERWVREAGIGRPAHVNRKLAWERRRSQH